MPAQPKEIVTKILGTLGFTATVEEHQFDDGLLLDVKTEDSGRLIGRQGQTLADLQYITNRILFQQDQNSPKVTVDVGGYRLQAREALIKKAKDAAEKVRRWGDADFRLRFLCSLLVFLVIFNHRSESPSFVIAMAGIAIWFVSLPIQVSVLFFCRLRTIRDAT